MKMTVNNIKHLLYNNRIVNGQRTLKHVLWSVIDKHILLLHKNQEFYSFLFI